MKNKMNILKFLSALTLLVLCQACVSASPQLAVASGNNGIYLLRTEGTWAGGTSYRQIYSSAISGITTVGNTIYAVDSTNSAMVVITVNDALTSPTITSETVDLNGLLSPNKITVNSNGGVYVTSNKTGTSGDFAYLYKSSGNWSTSYGTSGISIADVTSYSSGAFIAGVNMSVGGSDKPTSVASIQGSHISGPNDITGSLAGRAVTVLSGVGSGDMAYVGSGDNEASQSGYAQGIIDVVNPATRNVAQSLLLDSDLDPQDLMTYAYGDKKYLFVIGKPNDDNGVSGGAARAWSYEIDATTGLIIEGSKTTQIPWSQEERYGQQCALSSDGSIIWTTHVNSTGPTVLAYSISDWGYTVGNFADTSSLGIQYISAFDYINTVPEPSSLVALLSMSAGAIAFLRRRKP